MSRDWLAAERDKVDALERLRDSGVCSESEVLGVKARILDEILAPEFPTPTLHAEVDAEAGELVIRCGKAEMRLPTSLEPLLPPSGLPEGVHAAPDGTLLARGGSIPEGWERAFLTSVGDWTTDPSQFPDAWYEVRPVAPEPERVPWWEAVGRQVREVSGEWDTVTAVLRDSEYLDGAVVCLADPIPADADGMVAVLPLDGDQ